MAAFEDDALQAACHAPSGACDFPHGQAGGRGLCVDAPVDARGPVMRHARVCPRSHMSSALPQVPILHVHFSACAHALSMLYDGYMASGCISDMANPWRTSLLSTSGYTRYQRSTKRYGKM